MKQHEKLLAQIPRGTSDASISFIDLRQVLIRLGFGERTSH